MSKEKENVIVLPACLKMWKLIRFNTQRTLPFVKDLARHIFSSVFSSPRSIPSKVDFGGSSLCLIIMLTLDCAAYGSGLL